MAKNIVIAEGGTAKSFTAKKIKTKAQGSGTVDWIPEDEAIDYVDIKDHKFTAKGTYNPSDFNCDGFGQVIIDIPSDVKEKTIVKNGVFYAADDGCLGYSKVTIAVPGGGGGGPFTVTFLDQNDNILEVANNVPYGGGAFYHGVEPTSSGMRFVGWNPLPMGVTENLNCYPRFENITYEENIINDDWTTLANNCKHDMNYYPTGSVKLLELTNGTIVKMQLVAKGVDPAEGENGYANTTWLSTHCLPKRQFHTSQTVQYGWANSALRAYLNGEFADTLFPAEIKKYLRNVIKYTNVAISSGTLRDYPTVDLFWVPSMKEIGANYNNVETLGTFYDVAFGLNGSPNQNARKKFDAYSSSIYESYWTRTSHSNSTSNQWHLIINNSGNGSEVRTTSSYNYLIGFCL